MTDLNDKHPQEGDFLRLTGVVQNRFINGLPLPNGKLGGNIDGRLEGKDYRVYVDEINKIGEYWYTLKLIKPCGDRVKVNYRPTHGNVSTISASNSMKANQSWKWEKVK